MESRLEDTARRRAATQARKLTIRAFSASHRFQGSGYCQPGIPRMSGRWWAMPLWQSMQVFSPLNRKRWMRHRCARRLLGDVHAPAARLSICVVASGGHAVSHAFEFRSAYRGTESGEGHRRNQRLLWRSEMRVGASLFRQAEFSEAGLGSAGEYTAQNNKRVAGET